MTKDEEDNDLGKTPPQPPVSMPLTLPARLARSRVIFPISTTTRMIVTRQSVSSQGKTEISQKTSDSLVNLRIDNTNVDGAPEANSERLPCI